MKSYFIGEIPRGVAYEMYCEWCSANRIKPETFDNWWAQIEQQRDEAEIENGR